MSKDLFAHKADNYDQDADKIANVDNIANGITSCVVLKPTMHLMDFGSGTGLLLERIAPFVEKITAVDSSPAMISQLAAKRSSLACQLDIIELDFEVTDLDQKFDGIISSMTMHHVKDTAAMFLKFYESLNDDGVIAIADLDTEDGRFHADNTGVYHHGFNRDEMLAAARQAKFKEAAIATVSIAKSPHGKQYPVFLLTAKK